jgi:uncharacterized protein (DUF111 family)
VLALAREWVGVETPYGTEGVKVARMGGKVMTAPPEYKDCRCLAPESGVPLKEVYVAAEAALRRMGLPLTLANVWCRMGLVDRLSTS